MPRKKKIELVEVPAGIEETSNSAPEAEPASEAIIPSREISPGLYSFREIFELLDFNIDEITDYRRVKISKLGFNTLDDQFRVPDEGDILVEITLDDQPVAAAIVNTNIPY